jgi:hypothetical protein
MRLHHHLALTLRLAGVMCGTIPLITPAAVRAQTDVAVIPSVQAKLSSLRFFETGPVIFAPALRSYDVKFEAARARFIGVELTFQHPAPGRVASFTVSCAYRTASDSLIGQIEVPFTIQADWQYTATARNLGYADPGHWKPGTYRTTCTAEGRTVAQGIFEIVAGPPDINSFPAKLARIRLFPSGGQAIAREQRAYGVAFPGAQTSYINVEVELAHEPPGRDVSVPIGCLVIRANGTIAASMTMVFDIKAEWRNTLSSQGWGTSQPGFWTAGVYRVACSAEGKLLGQELFEVT